MVVIFFFILKPISHFGADTEKSHFTRDPAQLKGVLVRASLRKSAMGFGFTIIGGDRPDEFLQVKNVLKDGPAAQDGKIAPGGHVNKHTRLCSGCYRHRHQPPGSTPD